MKTVLDQPELYHLFKDPSERFNVAEDNEAVVERILEAVRIHQAVLEILAPLFDVRLSRL